MQPVSIDLEQKYFSTTSTVPTWAGGSIGWGHWPPGQDQVTILLRITISKLIWNMLIHHSSHATASLMFLRNQDRLEQTVYWKESTISCHESIPFSMNKNEAFFHVCSSHSRLCPLLNYFLSHFWWMIQKKPECHQSSDVSYARPQQPPTPLNIKRRPLSRGCPLFPAWHQSEAKIELRREGVVVKLVERWQPTSEVSGSNPILSSGRILV